MNSSTFHLHPPAAHTAQAAQAAEQAELDAIAAESIGWLPLGEGAYLHLGSPDDGAAVISVISVVGIPDAAMAGSNILLVGW